MTHGGIVVDKPNIPVGCLVRTYVGEIDPVRAWKLNNNDNENSSFHAFTDGNELGMILDVKYFQQTWYFRTLVNNRTGWIESRYLRKACP